MKIADMKKKRPKCPHCGATDDQHNMVDHFVCGHCGQGY